GRVPGRVPTGAGSGGRMRRWLVASMAAAGLLAAGCGGAARPSSLAQTPPAHTTTRPLPAQPARPKPRPRPALPPANNGSLPQTDQRPSAGTPAFKAEMAAFWTGVKANSVHAALPAFFP